MSVSTTLAPSVLRSTRGLVASALCGPWLRRRGTTLLVVLFLLTRGALLLAAQPWDQERKFTQFIYSDAEYYYHAAVNLLDGHGFSASKQAPYSPATTRPPLYSLFLAAFMAIFGRSITGIVLGQALLQALTLSLIYYGAKRLFSRGVAFWLTLYSILDPVLLAMCGYLYSETLYYLLHVVMVFLLLAGAASGFGFGRVFAIALLLGLGLLARPIGLFFVPVMILVLALSTRRVPSAVGKSAVLLVTIVAVIAPWLVRNHRLSGHWSMSTIQGQHVFYLYVAPFLAAREKIPTDAMKERLQATEPHDFPDAFARSDYLMDQAVAEIKRHPLAYTFYHFAHAAPVLVGANSGAMAALVGWDHSSWPALGGRDIRSLLLFSANLLLLAVLYGSFTYGVWRLWVERRLLLLFITLAGIAYFLWVIGPEASSRYRLSLLPFVLFGAGYGLHSLQVRSDAPREDHGSGDSSTTSRSQGGEAS